MGRQYQTSRGFVNETGTRQYQVPGGFLNETVAAAVPFTAGVQEMPARTPSRSYITEVSQGSLSLLAAQPDVLMGQIWM